MLTSKAVLVLASTLVAAFVTVTSGNAQVNNEATKEQQFEARRENFSSGRRLLRTKGVTFEPDELLRDDWWKTLKPSLDAMPEMHQVRRETAPLRGAYIADTIYLPERVQIDADTLILANNIVFEGHSPVIKGPHAINVFPTKPIAVLGTTLSEALRKKPRLVNAALGNAGLPSFSLIRDVSENGRHLITFDTSGPEPKEVRPRPKKRLGLESIAWELWFPASMQNEDTSGNTGITGTSGTPGTRGADGVNMPKGAAGDCSEPGLSNDGTPGRDGGDGQAGTDGSPGGSGGPGTNADAINVFIKDGDLNQYKFTANGGTGGLGGEGGNAGAGGNGGSGGDGGDGIACNCNSIGNGGPSGRGGFGGAAGRGGDGGTGGTGGNGGAITVSLPAGSPGALVSNTGGRGGLGGSGGLGATGGSGGIPGDPGTGAVACGVIGKTGQQNVGGLSGTSGAPGNSGANGAGGQNGPTPQITFRTTSNPPPPPSACNPEDPSAELQSGPTNDPSQCTSPIIIDTGGNGYHLTSAANGVVFDISGRGTPIRLGWTTPGSGDAFLALPGLDGKVSNGTQLFGNFSPQPPSATPNGYAALAVYDQLDHGGNGDGVIDQKDQIFSSLRLWLDENHDGVCQPGELHTLPELGVLSISLSYSLSRRVDDFGNVFRYRADVNSGMPGGSNVGRKAFDVFLTTR